MLPICLGLTDSVYALYMMQGKAEPVRFFRKCYMKIIRIINNSMVCVEHGGKEMIVTEKGIGFNKQKGQEVDIRKVEKVYQLQERKDCFHE